MKLKVASKNHWLPASNKTPDYYLITVCLIVTINSVKKDPSTYIVALTPVEYLGFSGHNEPGYSMLTPVAVFTTINKKNTKVPIPEFCNLYILHTVYSNITAQ